MNLKNIEYFTAIVDNDFNITQAAKKLYISQPALSKGIASFEKENGVTLFERSKGRLKRLTPAGTALYINGEKLLESYKLLIENVRNEADEISGDINIGIAPVIISHLFPSALPKYIRENENINLHIFEEGAVSLKEKLIDDKIHMATALFPTGLDRNKFDQVKLDESHLAIFLDTNNPLAKKKALCWEDFDEQPIALFSDTYMINQQLTEYFINNNVSPRVQLKSDSWDLLLKSTRHSNLITVLPKPLSAFHNMEDIVMLDFEEDVKWDIYLCRKKKKVYSNAEEHTFNFFIEYFQENTMS